MRWKAPRTRREKRKRPGRKRRRHRSGEKIEEQVLSLRGKVGSRLPGGEALFQRMFTRIGCEGRPPQFHVEFYTYSSLVITLRRRGDVYYVRFSDLLQRAPLQVLEGAAALLRSEE